MTGSVKVGGITWPAEVAAHFPEEPEPTGSPVWFVVCPTCGPTPDPAASGTCAGCGATANHLVSSKPAGRLL